MKLKHIISGTTAALAAAMLFSGCATRGYQKADQTGNNLNRFRGEIVELKQAVEGTLSALVRISEAASTNPRPAFEVYAKSLGRLDAAGKKAQSKGEVMRAQGKAYFDAW